MADYLAGLNEAQWQAVRHQRGPLLIVAGAGAGKTKTLTYRVLHLIKQGVAPDQILAVTFTNKAAREMRERILTLLGIDPATEVAATWALAGAPHLPLVSTFHSLGVLLLRRHGGVLGLPKHFSISDKEDSLKLLKEALALAALDSKQYEPKKIAAIISRQKGLGLTAAAYIERQGNDFFPALVARAWQHYDQLLAKRHTLDFDDLLLKTLQLLEQPEIRDYYQNQFQYIHIDEYQDTNSVQYQLVKILAGKHRNLCVVGDVDQSIYSWRGADFKNILRFEKDYPDARVIRLEENYRSTEIILTAANEVIKKNKQRLEKNLFTKQRGGEPLTEIIGLDEREEAELVTREIKQLISRGVAPKNIAVLYRANFQSRALEEACLEAAVPYRVFGTRFFERQEVKDLLAFLRAAQNEDDIESFKRISNVPPRGIGKVTLAKLFTTGRASLPKAAQEKIKPLDNLLKQIREAMTSRKPSELLKFVLEAAGITRMFKDEGSEEALERLENLRELVSLASKYDGLPAAEGTAAFLTDAALMAADESGEAAGEAVNLMTVHAAKGLEFDAVFITGLEQDLFPHQRLGHDDEVVDEEEERRLFYVALTRARERVYLSLARLRTIFGAKRATIPSEFIADIPEHLIAPAKENHPYILID